MRLLCGLLVLNLIACARPDYLDPQQNVKQDNSQQNNACTLLFSKSQLCASLEWTQGPQSSSESEFIVKFWDHKTSSATGPFQDPPQTLSVILWMPSMGHGSSPVKIEKLQDGVFRVRRAFFIMPGDWEIRFFLKNQNTILDQTEFKLVI